MSTKFCGSQYSEKVLFGVKTQSTYLKLRYTCLQRSTFIGGKFKAVRTSVSISGGETMFVKMPKYS